MGKIRFVWVAHMLWDSRWQLSQPSSARTSVFCRILNNYGTAHERKLAYQSGAAKISPKSILEADVNFLGKGGVLTQHSPLWDASEKYFKVRLGSIRSG